MTQEEYKQLRHQAQQQMIDDYRWLLSEPPQPRQWRCSSRWLIELVHDVSDHLPPMLDDLHRPVQLQVLYQQFFHHVDAPLPKKPSKALSKLHTSEQQRGISPDSITLFYMRQMQGQELQMPEQPPRRIIELLMLE